jgi:hypothetical protein
MSTNYDMELQRALDLLVYTQQKKVLRSDDYEVLSLYSGDEPNAIEGLRTFCERHASYYDPITRKMRAGCDILEESGHLIVDIIHIFPNPEERIQREKYIEQHRRNDRRYKR